MKIFFAFLLVVFLVFSGYHLSFQKFRIPLFARKFYLTGLEFLFLGLLLGPNFLNILDKETCEGLAPLSALVLGWIGMLFGFQFEIPNLRRFPGVYFLAAFLESAVTLVIVFSGVYLCLPFVFDISGVTRIVASIAVAAAAACTAQTGLALIPTAKKNAGQSIIRILRYFSSIDGLVAMLALMPVYVFSLRNADIMDHRLMFGGDDILITIILFTAILTLYSLFLNQRREESELALIIIGMVIFISGFSWVMDFSPLLANFFVGMFLVNLTNEKEKIFNTLVSIEKPVYLLLLIFLGSGWQLHHLSGFAAAGAYFMFRFFGKIAGGFSVSRMGGKMGTLPSGLGLGLMGQGGLPLAILYDFYQSRAFDFSGDIIGIALIAIIFSDITSPALVRRLLRKKG